MNTLGEYTSKAWSSNLALLDVGRLNGLTDILLINKYMKNKKDIEVLCCFGPRAVWISPVADVHQKKNGFPKKPSYDT